MMRIFVKSMLLCVFLLASACGKDEDTIASEQTKIVSYLTTRLQVEEGSYDNLGGVFRYVGNAGRDGYSTAVEAAAGDSVSFYFSAHLLNTSADITAQPLIYTNKQRLINGIVGLTDRWSSELYKAKLGSSSLVKGLQRGLTGAHEKDSLLLFMTSDMGYGKHEMFNVPKNSSLLFVIELVSVKKQ